MEFQNNQGYPEKPASKTKQTKRIFFFSENTVRKVEKSTLLLILPPREKYSLDCVNITQAEF